MGQSIVCFNFNVPRRVHQGLLLSLFSFIEFGEKFTIAIAHYSTFTQDFLLVTSVALILNCVQRTVGMAQYFGHMASFASSVAGIRVGGIKISCSRSHSFREK